MHIFELCNKCSEADSSQHGFFNHIRLWQCMQKTKSGWNLVKWFCQILWFGLSQISSLLLVQKGPFGLNKSALPRSLTLTHHHRLWKWVALSTSLKLTQPHLHLKSVTVLFSKGLYYISAHIYSPPGLKQAKERRLIPLLCLFHVLLPGFIKVQSTSVHRCAWFSFI